MSLAGGSVVDNTIVPTPDAFIGETVLVRVVPISPEFYLGPETASQAAMDAGYYPTPKPCSGAGCNSRDHPRDNRRML